MGYNGTQYPLHGGNGGGLVARLDIANSDYVDTAILHYGSVMYGMTLGKVTSNGTRSRREVATLAYQAATAYLGSPCPVGLYRLAAVRGTSNIYVNEVRRGGACVRKVHLALLCTVHGGKGAVPCGFLDVVFTVVLQ